MQNRDLGELGETEFRRLCNAIGLTVHKSEMDRTGWDFLVEFPCKHESHLPQDLASPPLECKIQVKSTDKRSKRESIKLSNLNRLVKAQMPAFFCFIEFDGEDRAKAGYLVHVGQEIIERTLKRIRELENQGKGNYLNKSKISIAYKNAVKLEPLTGKSLKDAIERNVPNGMEEYIKSKNEILKTVGFEDGKLQITFTVASDDPIGDLLDVSLGLRQEINIQQSSIYHKRFGILSNNPNTVEGGVISISCKPVEAKLKFREHKFSPEISFAAKLHIPPLNRFIPRERIKFRVESRFFELILESDQINYSIRPYPNEKVPLKEFINFLELLSILEKASKAITIELESKEISSSSIFEFSLEELPPSLFEIIASDGQTFTWSYVADIARKLVELCRKIDISEQNLLLQIDDLLNLHHYADFELLYQALCGSVDSIIFLFPDGVDRYEKDAKAAFVCFAQACVDNHAIGYCLGVVGSFSSSCSQQALVGEKILIGQSFIKTDGSRTTKEEIEPAITELVNELENEGLPCIVECL